MVRSDMSDLELEFIKAALPNNTRGKKRVDDRRVINGIFYVLCTGPPWADLPSEYGRPTTVYNRFNRWSYAGHWDRIMGAIADVHNVDTVMVDGTSVRAHHSATTLKRLSLQIVCMGLRLRWRGKRGVRRSPVQGAGTIAGSCRDIWLRRLGSAAGNSSTGCVDC